LSAEDRAEPVPPRRLSRRRLTFEQANYQCGTALGRSTLDFI